MNENEPRRMTVDMLEPGDVLMGYSHLYAGELGGRTGYSHAAIHLGNGQVLESDAQGVRISDVDDLHLAYDHLAVLRTHGQWTEDRLEKLRSFAQRHVGKPFNGQGVQRIEERRDRNTETAMQQYEQYFKMGEHTVKIERGVYFCSQLVAAAFLDAELIGIGAGIEYRPEIMTPADIVSNKAFGFFVGYLPKVRSGKLPDDDWFIGRL